MNLKRKHIHTVVAATLLSAGTLAFSGNVLANDSAELEALRALVQELDQKVRVLDRKGELAEEKAASEKKRRPKSLPVTRALVSNRPTASTSFA